MTTSTKMGIGGVLFDASDTLFGRLVDDEPDLVAAAVDLGYAGVAIDRYGGARRPGVEWIGTLDELVPLLEVRGG